MSAYRFQLTDARANIRIRNVIGTCGSSAEFASIINTVTETLWNRGAWWGSEVVVKLCVFGCNIVWPRYVGSIQGLRTCAGQNDVKNGWYAILGPRGCQGWSSNVTAFDNGTSPTFNDIADNTGHLLRYHVVKANDYGKTITFFGKQYGAQPLQEVDANGVWQMGLTLAAANPIAQTTVLVTYIDQITREATQGMAYLYEYNTTTLELRMLGIYEPNNTNPQFRRSKIEHLNLLPYSTDANGRKSWTVEALVKLEFIPVENDRDFLLIDNWAALAYGIQALKLDEANDPQNAEIFWAKSLREMNYESRNRNPANQFVTRVNVTGSNRTISNFI